MSAFLAGDEDIAEEDEEAEEGIERAKRRDSDTLGLRVSLLKVSEIKAFVICSIFNCFYSLSLVAEPKSK